MYLWEEASSTSYFSAVLIPPSPSPACQLPNSPHVSVNRSNSTFYSASPPPPKWTLYWDLVLSSMTVLMPMDKFLKFVFPPLDNMRIVLFCPFEVVVRKKSDHRWAVPNLVLDSRGLQDKPSLPAQLAMADTR